MNLIVSEVYDALIEAGATEEKAKAAAGAIPFAEHLATKEDISRLEAATKEDIAGLSATTSEKFAKLEKDVAVLKLAVFTFEPAVLALLVKLLFFP